MMVFRLIKNYTPLLLLLILISCNKTDWEENFKEKEKSPFGNYIIYNEASQLLGKSHVTLLKENIYDYLAINSVIDSIETKNYVSIKNAGYKYPVEVVPEFLDFVAKGNNVFLAFNQFKDSLKSALHFSTNNLDDNVFSISRLKKLKGELSFKNTQFSKSSFNFDRNLRRNYFLEYDENTTTVLGTIKVDGESVPNFIRINHGKGAFFLNLHPIAFTNYNLLNGKEVYAANAFSYLPNKKRTLWDPQIKSSKYVNKKENDNNIFKFFLKHPTLKLFLFVSLIGLLLFLLFNARRKQRPIPVIEPLKNSTVAFTQTIANLYLKEEDHKNLVDKKIAYFLEKVRTKYLLNTSNLNNDFIDKLASKSGNDIQKTKYLVNTIITLNKNTECSKEQLIVLHKMIEKFL